MYTNVYKYLQMPTNVYKESSFHSSTYTDGDGYHPPVSSSWICIIKTSWKGVAAAKMLLLGVKIFCLWNVHLIKHTRDKVLNYIKNIDPNIPPNPFIHTAQGCNTVLNYGKNCPFHIFSFSFKKLTKSIGVDWSRS
jgi:hypothetical protein